MTWAELQSDTAMLSALEVADVPVSRSQAVAGSQDARRRWSDQFAKACATMIANSLREQGALKGSKISPDPKGAGQESFTPLGYKRGKRIDVVVSRDPIGLQIGVSLKGLNFRDGAGENFDKNLTGRLYELRDEVSTVHDYLPRAFMAGMIFLPIGACFDKVKGPSSFARTVVMLRARTGRLDPSIASQNWRCDFGAVALYSPGGNDETSCGLPKGVVRYFPLHDQNGRPTPTSRRGLPLLPATLTLSQISEQLVNAALHDTASAAHLVDEADESVKYSGMKADGTSPPAPAEHAEADTDALDLLPE